MNNSDNNYETCMFCECPRDALKDKCPECGEMEIIGRAVCEKKYAHAKRAQAKVISEAGIIITALHLLFGLFICFCSSWVAYILAPHAIAMTIGFVATLYLGVSMVFKAIQRREEFKENARQTFLKENPEYAEIFKKEEEG